MNSSMFFPLTEDVDYCHYKGEAVDDVNSITEYVYQEIYDQDAPFEDQDKSSQHFTTQVKVDNLAVFPSAPLISHNTFLDVEQEEFAEFRISSVPAVSLELFSPPPEA